MGKKKKGKFGEQAQETYVYPKQDTNLPEEGWVLVELRHCLWSYANLELVIKTNDTVDSVIRKIQTVYGRVDQVLLYAGEYTQEHNKITKHYQTIGNLLQTFGSQDKSSPERFYLYYDFIPYNPSEPVLLSI